MTGLSDSFQRPINYMRVSITDRCNLRCMYCMPPEGIPLIPHSEILSYEELAAIVRAAAALGITKVRLTGGEPLVRAGLAQLVKILTQINGIEEVSLTTNGVLLGRYAAELKEAGLKRVNVSLDSLKDEGFRHITRWGILREVLDGIEEAKAIGLNPVKVNMVVMRGINDDELIDFASKTIDSGWHVRFIELMPLPGQKRMKQRFVPASEMRRRIEKLGALEPCLPTVGNGPAKYFRLPASEGTIGFISPISEHFCFGCNRLRLTVEGQLRPCLLADDEVNLRRPLREGASQEELAELIEKAVASKPQRHQLREGVLPKQRQMAQIGG